jgi:hypothetical protein
MRFLSFIRRSGLPRLRRRKEVSKCTLPALWIADANIFASESLEDSFFESTRMFLSWHNPAIAG